jgi:CRP-like cAMP-binding protein
MVTLAATADAATIDTVQPPADGTVDAIVARAGLFETVDPAAVAAVTKQLLPVHFSHRQTVYTEGDPGEQLYIIASGKIKLGRRSADGRGHLLAIVGPSGMFGELSIFDPGPRTSSATALTDVSALSMNRDVLRGSKVHACGCGDQCRRHRRRRCQSNAGKSREQMKADARSALRLRGTASAPAYF